MRKLENDILLYHGSYCEVQQPDLKRCARYKDFGQGFYVTTSRRQAENFSKISTQKGIANDNTNATITTYMAGGFGELGTKQAEDICISLLLPERLQDQYCFRTEKALQCLTFVESEKIWL